MGQITPLVTAALPVATTLMNGAQRQSQMRSQASQNQAELEYTRQQDAARLEAERQAQERRYQEERAAREYDARVRQEQQEREWQRQDALRLQEQERQRRESERQAADAEARRQGEMAWLSRGQGEEYEQLRARQVVESQAGDADAGNRQAELAARAQEDERRRKDALRRAMGRTRAGLGAQGVTSADGSGEAILLGMVGETELEQQEALRVDTLKRQAIQQEVENRRRRNLLEQAQLAERQRLEFMSRYF